MSFITFSKGVPILTKIITTSLKAKETDILEAKKSAWEFNLQYIERKKLSWQDFFASHGIDEAFIQKGETINLVNIEGEELFFHPGTALIRGILLERGDGDPLIEAMGIEKDEKVLDCTGGLLNDALVLAYYLDKGQVTALEKSRDLYIVTKRGLLTCDKGSIKLREALGRIDLKNIDYKDFLQDRSLVKSGDYASIYFDPMFADPVDVSPGISKIRLYASYDSLEKSTIELALSLAQKRVVVKIRNNNRDFVSQMQPQKIIGGDRSRVRYAVFEK